MNRGSGKRMIVAQAVEAFLDDGRERKKWSQSTRNNYGTDLKGFAGRHGQLPVDQVSTESVRDYLDSLRNWHDDPVAPQTYNRHYSTLRSFFGWLESEGQIDTPPMAGVARKRIGEQLRPPMTGDQVQTFFAKIPEQRDRILFTVINECGLELSEALTLNIDDVYIADRPLQVSEKAKSMGLEKLSERTIRLLRSYVMEESNTREGPLFASKQGRPLSYSRAYRLFREYTRDIETSDGKPLTISQLAQSKASEQMAKMVSSGLRDSDQSKVIEENEMKENRELVLKSLLENGFKEFATGDLFGSVVYRHTIKTAGSVEVALRENFVRVTFWDTSQEGPGDFIYEAEALYGNWKFRMVEINERWEQIKKYRS